MYNINWYLRKEQWWLANFLKQEVARMENILAVIEMIYMTIIIIDYVKTFIDWYIDYKIDKKISNDKKNRCSYDKDEQR